MHSGGAFGNCLLSGTTLLLGSLRIKRRAFSEVTKSRSLSGSFPSLAVMRFSCESTRQDLSVIRFSR